MGPLETIQSGFDGWVRKAQAHLVGRGVVSGATILAFGIQALTGWFVVPLVVAIGGVGLHMFHRLRDQWAYQDEMANKYRGEIADRLGVAPETVTREHVKLAAYGDEQHGIDGNPVLAQALERQRSKSWLVFGTALLAGVVTFSVLMLTGSSVGGWLATETFIGGVPIVAEVVGMMSGAIVAGLSSLFIQDGLELLIGNSKGINAPSAHDRILAIEARQARGKSVTPEQIFQVKLAVSPELEGRVMGMTGKRFGSLNADMQQRVLARIDVKGEMLMIAEEINKKNLDAKELAFILVGQQPVHKSEVAKDDCKDAPERVAPERKQSFAEKLGFKPHRDERSHAERLDESRVVPIESGRAS